MSPRMRPCTARVLPFTVSASMRRKRPLFIPQMGYQPLVEHAPCEEDQLGFAVASQLRIYRAELGSQRLRADMPARSDLLPGPALAQQQRDVGLCRRQLKRADQPLGGIERKLSRTADHGKHRNCERKGPGRPRERE